MVEEQGLEWRQCMTCCHTEDAEVIPKWPRLTTCLEKASKTPVTRLSQTSCTVVLIQGLLKPSFCFEDHCEANCIICVIICSGFGVHRYLSWAESPAVLTTGWCVNIVLPRLKRATCSWPWRMRLLWLTTAWWSINSTTPGPDNNVPVPRVVSG